MNKRFVSLESEKKLFKKQQSSKGKIYNFEKGNQRGLNVEFIGFGGRKSMIVKKISF